MEIANRPAIGTRVRVHYAGSAGYDAETYEGDVTFQYPDGFDVRTNADVFTVFDSERARGKATVEVL